jgi:hypothetical protein
MALCLEPSERCKTEASHKMKFSLDAELSCVNIRALTERFGITGIIFDFYAGGTCFDTRPGERVV